MFTVATSSGHRGANGILRPLEEHPYDVEQTMRAFERLMSDFVPMGLSHRVRRKRAAGTV